eukprot:1244893-Pleurochrysis_carterae.AAC.1
MQFCGVSAPMHGSALALTVPPSDPDHVYLRSWINRVGACDLADLVRDDALLDTPLPERSSP